MKTTISTFAIMLLAFAFNSAVAQDNSIAYNSPEIKNALLLTNTSSPALKEADVNKKALNDFSKNFKNVQGERWYAVEDGFFATFNDNGMETKVAYDKKGHWHCTVRTLNESQLPGDVRNVVKSAYYDSKIVVGYEIKHSDGPVYIIKTEDSKSLQTLRVANGQMEIISDNKKE